ncbi:MAG: hypothetical protein QM796_18695 [Chthoniobacteraceae bacterium]
MTKPTSHSKPQQIALDCLFRVAQSALPTLPPTERADVYDGIAVAAAPHHRERSRKAARLATLIREVETLQLTFRKDLFEIDR